MKRQRLSAKARLQLFEDKRGICHICEQPIQVGQRWEVSHPIPLELGGADDDTNRDIAHKACHGEVTKKDVADIAKAKRRQQRHLGIRKPSSFQNSRTGKYKTKIGGRTELR